MKKYPIYIAVFSVLFGFFTFMNGQSLTLGPSGGITLVLAPDIFTNDTQIDPTSLEPTGFGFGAEMHIGGKAKLAFPLLPIKVTAHAYYTKLASENDISLPAALGGTNLKLESEITYLALGVGGEMKLIPGPISPFVGLDILMNTSNSITVKGTAGGQSFEESEDGNSMFGLGIGAGIEITILPKIDLDIEAKYNMNNLLKKASEGDENFNTLNLSVSVLFSIL